MIVVRVNLLPTVGGDAGKMNGRSDTFETSDATTGCVDQMIRVLHFMLLLIGNKVLDRSFVLYGRVGIEHIS